MVVVLSSVEEEIILNGNLFHIGFFSDIIIIIKNRKHPSQHYTKIY